MRAAPPEAANALDWRHSFIFGEGALWFPLVDARRATARAASCPLLRIQEGLASGKLRPNVDSVIMGHNRDESTLFVALYVGFTGSLPPKTSHY